MPATAPLAPRFAAGQVIAGRYHIEAALGEGGMGVVLRARQALSGQAVALKVLAPERMGQGAAERRMVREAQIVARLRSDHTVRLLDAGLLDDGAPYLIMELLEGQDLAQLLHTEGPQPLGRVLGWLLAACEAVGEAHTLGIIHRDLKPSNLFLARRPDGSERLKVLDFGLAKAIDLGGSETRSDRALGTLHYMAPEQVRSQREVDARADVWALAVVTYQLLTNQLPFEADSSSAYLAAIVADPPVPLRVRWPGAPPELEALLLRCLARNMADRLPSIGALVGELLPLVAAHASALEPAARRLAERPTTFPLLPAAATGDTTADPHDFLSPSQSAPPRPAEGSSEGAARASLTLLPRGQGDDSQTKRVEQGMARWAPMTGAVLLAVLGGWSIRPRPPTVTPPVAALGVSASPPQSEATKPESPAVARTVQDAVPMLPGPPPSANALPTSPPAPFPGRRPHRSPVTRASGEPAGLPVASLEEATPALAAGKSAPIPEISAAPPGPKLPPLPLYTTTVDGRR